MLIEQTLLGTQRKEKTNQLDGQIEFELGGTK